GFHDSEHERLVVPIGELTGNAGEEHEGQDEQPRCHVREELRLHRRVARGLIRREDYEHVLVDIVVERPERLRPKEGQKSALAQELELTGVGHVFRRVVVLRASYWMSVAARCDG